MALVSYYAGYGFITGTSTSISGQMTDTIDGDFVTAVVIHTSAVTPPTGWTLISSSTFVGSSTRYISVFSKNTVLSSDSYSTINFTQASSGYWEIASATYRSSSGTTLLNGASYASNHLNATTAYSLTPTTLTATNANELFVVCLSSLNIPGSVAPFVSSSGTVDLSSSTSLLGSVARTLGQSNSGTSGMGTGTTTNNGVGSIIFSLYATLAPETISETFSSTDALLNYKLKPADVTDGIGSADVTTTYYALSRVVTEIIQYTAILLSNATYGATLTDATAITDKLLLSRIVSLTDGVSYGDVLSVVRSILITEQLGIQHVWSAATTYNKLISEQTLFIDLLSNFFSGEIIEGVSVAASNVATSRFNVATSELIGISETLTKSFVVRITATEEITLNHQSALHMIFNPTVSEEFEITAAYISPDDDFTTWAINTRTGATTEYTNYRFNSFAQMGHKYLGASDNGLYELNGDTDNSTDIIAHIKSGFAQFAGSRFTLFKAAYLGMRGTGNFVLKLVSGDGSTYTYNLVGSDMKTAKVQLGKGLRARYFAFELISTGQDFDLESVEFIPLVADRRV